MPISLLVMKYRFVSEYTDIERSVIASEERRCARPGGGIETRKVGCSSGFGGSNLASRREKCWRSWRLLRLEGEMGSGCRVDGFAVLAFSSGAAVDEEREGDGENEEDEDCDGGYYAAVQTGVGVCWCVFETERRRGRGLR
jgi:hypothetical protein